MPARPRSALLAVALLVLPAAALAIQPKRLTDEEILARKNQINRALLVLTEVIPKARKNPALYQWLDIVHVPRPAYEQAVNRLLARAREPLEKSEIDFATHPSRLNCERRIEGSGNERAAYVPADERIIHMCDGAFASGPNELAHLLLHEFVHVQGIQNECDAEAIAYLTFRAAGTPCGRPTYLERCQFLKSFLSELNRR